MLHGMIPAAFFATLLRRYLDSLAETSENVAEVAAGMSYLNTSAVVASTGIALYGLSRLKKNSPKTEENEQDISTDLPVRKSEKHTCIKKRSKTPIKKRYRKKKKWFLKNMRHYKSKYGRKIGKLINQLLGIPYTETPILQPVNCEYDSDDSEDNITLQHMTNAVPLAPDVHHKPLPGHLPSTDSILHENYSTIVSKDDYYGDDDVDQQVEVADWARKSSSSLDLKNLLRENFERQEQRRLERSRNESARSVRSRDSSRRGRSSTGSHSTSSMNYSRCSDNNQRQRFVASDSRRKAHYRRGQTFAPIRNKSISKKTRSGRCYYNGF